MPERRPLRSGAVRREGATISAAPVPAERIPLNTWAIAFGLAGLAEAWTAATPLLGLPDAVRWVLWVVAAVGWIWLLVAHVARGLRTRLPLGDQLRHPAQGPIAALVPVVALLLGIQLDEVAPLAGAIVTGIALVAATGFAAWILGLWMRGGRPAEAVHGGYFLPTVAAGLVGATAAEVAGWHGIALGSFAVGILFWIVIQTVLVIRLAVQPPLPGPLTPTLAIMVAPPAVAGLAWFEINGGRVDDVQFALAGVLVLMLLIQLAFVARYRRLAFSLGFWSFTFPVAGAGAYGIHWAEIEGGAVGVIATIAILAGVTVLIGAIAVRSLVGRLRDRARHEDLEEETLEAADLDAAR